MALIRWTDNTPVWPRRTIASLFDNPFFSDFDRSDMLRLATEIKETEKEIVLTAEIPGMSVEDIKVTVENGVLTVSGEKKSENEQKGECFHCTERRFGEFERRFILPESIMTEKISAKSTNGLLTIVMPKAEKAKPKTIEVKIK